VLFVVIHIESTGIARPPFALDRLHLVVGRSDQILYLLPGPDPVLFQYSAEGEVLCMERGRINGDMLMQRVDRIMEQDEEVGFSIQHYFDTPKSQISVMSLILLRPDAWRAGSLQPQFRLQPPQLHLACATYTLTHTPHPTRRWIHLE